MKMPIKKLNALTDSLSYEGDVINYEILDTYGIFILKKHFTELLISKYLSFYHSYSNSEDFDRNSAHLTEVRIASGNPLLNIFKEPDFNKISLSLFSQGAGIYNIRIVKKDSKDMNPVFLHQDVGYQYGSFDRYSIFIPLTKCFKLNGGLTFIPGSHHFGYLGDAGAINNSIIPEDLLQISPTVLPGDVIIMNSYTWHKSGYNVEGSERIYFDIHLNKCSDPASKYLISSNDSREYFLNYNNDEIFENSRLQRINKFVLKYGQL